MNGAVGEARRVGKWDEEEEKGSNVVAADQPSFSSLLFQRRRCLPESPRSRPGSETAGARLIPG